MFIYLYTCTRKYVWRIYILGIIQKSGIYLIINNSKTNKNRSRQFAKNLLIIPSRKDLFKRSFFFHYKTNPAYFPSKWYKQHILSFHPEIIHVFSFVLRCFITKFYYLIFYLYSLTNY